MLKIHWKTDTATRTHPPSEVSLIWMRYNQRKNSQFFLSHTKQQAEDKMKQYMANRTPFEIDKEGWDVEAFELFFSPDGETFVSEDGMTQMQDLSRMLLGQ